MVTLLVLSMSSGSYYVGRSLVSAAPAVLSLVGALKGRGVLSEVFRRGGREPVHTFAPENMDSSSFS
jgi:hypothetical protein